MPRGQIETFLHDGQWWTSRSDGVDVSFGFGGRNVAILTGFREAMARGIDHVVFVHGRGGPVDERLTYRQTGGGDH